MQFPLQARADVTMGLQCQSNSHCIPMVTSARACYENCIEFSLFYEKNAISITRHKKHWFNVYCRHHQLQDLHNFETSNSVCIIECEAKNDSCVIGQHCDNNLIHIMYALCITILHYRIISSSKYCRVRLEWVSEFSSVFWRLHKVQCLVFEHELQEVHHLEFSGFSKACIHILAKICLLSTTKTFN